MFLDHNTNHVINNEDSSKPVKLNVLEGRSTVIKFIHFGTTIINKGILKMENNFIRYSKIIIKLSIGQIFLANKNH